MEPLHGWGNNIAWRCDILAKHTTEIFKQSKKNDSHHYWAHNVTSYNAINVSIYYLFNILIKCRARRPVDFINITYEYRNLNWIGFSASKH